MGGVFHFAKGGVLGVSFWKVGRDEEDTDCYVKCWILLAFRLKVCKINVYN